MQVVLSTPQYLQGQNAGQLFDPSRADATTRGNGPSGVLGASITLTLGYLNQALAMGFTITTYIFG